MKTFIASVAVAACVFGVACPTCMAQRAPESPRAPAAARAIADTAHGVRWRVAEMIRFLERNPLHRDARAIRGELLCWLIDTDDVVYEACSELLAPLASAHRDLRDILTTQAMLSGALFCLQHPDSARSRPGIARAGLLGSLHVYETIVRTRPALASPSVEYLIEQRDYGDFDAHIEASLVRCFPAD